MGIEYIGELLPDGHLSIDPSVISKIREGEQLKINIEPLKHEPEDAIRCNKKIDAATQRFLSRLENAPRLGQIRGDLSREDIYEDMANEKL